MAKIVTREIKAGGSRPSQPAGEYDCQDKLFSTPRFSATSRVSVMFPKRKPRRRVSSYQRIPRASTQTDTVIAHAEAANTVLMANQRSDLLATGNIPDLAFEVVVTGKQQSARHRGGNRGDAAQDRLGLRMK